MTGMFPRERTDALVYGPGGRMGVAMPERTGLKIDGSGPVMGAPPLAVNEEQVMRGSFSKSAVLSSYWLPNASEPSRVEFSSGASGLFEGVWLFGSWGVGPGGAADMFWVVGVNGGGALVVGGGG